MQGFKWAIWSNFNASYDVLDLCWQLALNLDDIWDHVLFGKWWTSPPISLTLFAPAYLSVSKDRIVWFELAIQIFLEIASLAMICHIQRIHELWMTRTPQRKWWTFMIFHWSPTQFVRVPLMKFRYFRWTSFFFKTRYLKSVLPFSKLKIGKSQVFRCASIS